LNAIFYICYLKKVYLLHLKQVFRNILSYGSSECKAGGKKFQFLNLVGKISGFFDCNTLIPIITPKKRATTPNVHHKVILKQIHKLNYLMNIIRIL